MDFALSEQKVAIDEGVRKGCAGLDDAYWSEWDESKLPHGVAPGDGRRWLAGDHNA